MNLRVPSWKNLFYDVYSFGIERLGPLFFVAPGQDQINVRIPRSLIGKGEIDLALTVDSRSVNVVKVNVK